MPENERERAARIAREDCTDAGDRIARQIETASECYPFPPTPEPGAIVPDERSGDPEASDYVLRTGSAWVLLCPGIVAYLRVRDGFARVDLMPDGDEDGTPLATCKASVPAPPVCRFCGRDLTSYPEGCPSDDCPGVAPEIGDPCPSCGELLDGLIAEPNPDRLPCPDCAAGRVRCHACGWPDRKEGEEEPPTGEEPGYQEGAAAEEAAADLRAAEGEPPDQLDPPGPGDLDPPHPA